MTGTGRMGSDHRFDPAVLAADPERRGPVLAILEGALRGADPEAAVARHLRLDGDQIVAGGARIAAGGHVYLLAVGKAAPAMARAAVSRLPRLSAGLVVSDHREPVPDGLDLLVAGHPVPDVTSLEAGRAALSLARRASAGDLVVFLLSGGGSALLESLPGRLALADLRSVNRMLLEAGAAIEDVNTVRRHLSRIKGGRLAAAVAPARLVTLVLSDVVGDRLEAIASGPTVADPTTAGDALAVLRGHGLADRVPAAVLDHLRTAAPQAAPPPETVVVVVGNAASAAGGAAAAARARGLEARVATAALSGDAAAVAEACVARPAPGVTVYAGETTVTVTGSGRGGRNQQAALAAAVGLEGRSGVVFAALGTDGVDGPTDAAGAIVDGGTVPRGREAGLDAARHLVDNDAHRFLDAAGDLLRTGPTGTNVGDVWVVLSSPLSAP